MRQRQFMWLFSMMSILFMFIPVGAKEAISSDVNEFSIAFIHAYSTASYATSNKVDTAGNFTVQQKATNFIKKLGTNAKVLLKLPAKAPHCVFYKENRVVKCYNVETDSTAEIVFPDIDKTSIVYILAGDSNIVILDKTPQYGSPNIVRYNIATKKFYNIELGQNHDPDEITYGVYEVNKPIVSFTNRTFSYSFTEGRKGDTGLFDITSELGDNCSLEEWDAYMKKFIYHKVTQVFSFDGTLKSEVAKQVTWGEYMKSLHNNKRKR